MRTITIRNAFIAAAIALSCALPSFALAQPAPPSSSGPGGATGGAERITAMLADITVEQSGVIQVRESIEYYFAAPRHGIYRDLPVRYDIDGKTVEMPVSAISVTDATGAPVQHKEQRNKDSVRIIVGDPDRTVTGTHDYVISYDVRGALRYFADHDELYWNATGNTWTVPIERSGATVHLPPGVPQGKATFTCFTGAVGSTAKDCMANVQGSAVSYAANGPLTIVAGWPTGLVARLDPRAVPPVETQDVLPFLLPLLVIIGLYAYWRKYGRDPLSDRALMVQYDPPPGMRPAEVGALMHESARPDDLSCTVVDLAVRGYLSIKETEIGLLFKGKDYEITLLKKEYRADATLKPFETALLDGLFADGTKDVCAMSALKKDYSLNAHLADISKKTMDGIVAMGVFDGTPMVVMGKFVGVGILVAFVGFLLGTSTANGALPTPVVIAMVASGIIIAIAGKFMPRKSLAGAEAFQHARGFKEYVEKAEKYRIQWQEKENMFETFLPYAMVFGVVDKWTHALASMGIVPKQPGWYAGSPGSVFNAAAFGSSMASMNASVKAAMISSPQRSSGGSGFGGGSGGGGGGGGGGSW
ncbi:MAG: hypothetical protein RLZZ324_1139 [Candidatus Parcubacteria bacterium]|jgi:uncharacterized membrane protein YgcG